MTSMRTALLRTALAGAALLLVSGCDAAGDVASSATDAAKTRASAEASSAVSGVIQDQICNLSGDGRLSDDDIQTLSGLVDKAAAAGVSSDILEPVRDIVDAGEAKATDVQDLQENCPKSSS